jgi:cation/acetate symporter
VATARLAIIVEMVAWAFSIGAASFFPALVMGIWWKRANYWGAVTGMLAGFGMTIFYMVGSRFFGLSWFNTNTVASGVFGIPLGFITIYVVSMLTKAPSQEMQDFVVDIRYPKTGGASEAINAGH